MPVNDLDMPEVVRYAKSKGIGVWVYVNQRALSAYLDEILPLYESWGIAGIKFGFVHVGLFRWTTWLHDAVKKCARHHLMVDIHDEYRPTGFSRTYPNLLTQEGVRGNEEFPDGVWYVGCLTNNDARKLDVSLDFLDKGKKYELTMFTDGGEKVKTRTHVAIDTKKVTSKTVLKLSLLPRGGVAMIIKEVKE